ncbi:basic-leucine zipper transcription factor [Scheffersomyces stipitis CBS 6054]|uniref:Basic-leucine zipper transcription factor n=1 Tax=Scheffersomyces stipitis (strain ATCC 58785 / CBS 6054 / NBRC 10063 / NRRL Y-11545) TaxID=322104 RepID=A3GHB6_PICST|nr:basic-leucine zipper transcription factor [Scheffersomyces stipitis CBS 6054]EAZ63026.2 basic-leucine zipper transcription factor [Scheffersomyces stipitis CBS 6054]
MNDVKRNYAEVLSSESPMGSTPDAHDDKKLHTKPGRKPIETEPKSKRTAQNRAAQRAYRERKERKMKDLEDKVKSLEDENIKATTEADFLKAQVDMLKNELARYRGHTDFSDLNLPTKVGNLSNPNTSKSGSYNFNSASSTASSAKSANSVQHTSTSSSLNDNSPRQFSVDFPWSKDNLMSLKSGTNVASSEYNANQQVPDLVSGSSSSTSPLNDNLLVSPDSSVSSASNPINVNTNLDFTSSFDEQLDPFCVKLNEACGTKQCPVPKTKRNDSRVSQSSIPNQFSSPFSNLVTPTPQNLNDIDYLSDPFFNQVGDPFSLDFNTTPSHNNEDPLSFLNDNNFDVSLAFGDPNPRHGKDELDPIALLTTEESIYDPLKDTSGVNVNFNFNDFVKSSLPSETTPKERNYTLTEPSINEEVAEDDDDDAVVPAPEQTIRCSEIWDRITAHPKYTEIDIDGLCNELKSKAKCSEKGVVINAADVNQLLEQSAMKRR